MLSSDLRRALVMAIGALQVARDPWWIISSAAVALHGVTPIDPADVDILTSVADAHRLMTDLAIVAETDTASDLFRSAVFGRWTVPPLPVEIMAHFHVATATGWTPITPRTRVPIAIGTRRAYVPDRRELAAMSRVFGRPKDLERARLLEALHEL